MNTIAKFLENLLKLRNFTEPSPNDAGDTAGASSTSSGTETTLEILHPFFKFLARTGIYPNLLTFEIKKDDVNANAAWSSSPNFAALAERRHIEQLRMMEKNIFFYLRLVLMTTFVSNVCFCIVQLIRCSLLDKNCTTWSKTGTVVWVCVCFPALITIFWFHWKKYELIQFLQQWLCIEKDIFARGDKNSSLVKQYGGKVAFENQRWKYKAQLIFLCFFMMSVCSASFNQTLFPRHPIFIYSLVDPDVEIYWFRIVSFLFQSFAYVIIIIGISLFEMVAMMFSGSVVECLKIISFENEGGAGADEQVSLLEMPTIIKISTLSIHDSPVSARFHNSLIFYAKLEFLVEKFNKLFTNLVFFLKMMNLVSFCFMVYVSIRFRDEMPLVALMVFMTGSVAYIFRWSRLLISLGSTAEQSISFRQSWVSAFDKLDHSPETQTDKEKLQFSQMIQFKSGSFYRIGPSTVLTYFSIATTYLIVLLQL